MKRTMNNQTPTSYIWAELVQKLRLPTAPAVRAKTPKQYTSGGRITTTIAELMQRQCVDGERTEHLTKLVGTLLAAKIPTDAARQQCHAWNERNFEPLDEDKIDDTFSSIHATDQRNHPERYPLLLTPEPLFNLSAGRIDRYLANDPPLRRWLLKELVVLGKVGAIVAPGGSSKSQWLLQLAVGVATGIPVAGHWEVGETGGVLAFFAEDDEDEIHRRLKRIVDHLTTAGHAQDLAGIEDRFYAYSTIGHNTLLTKRETSGEVTATTTGARITALAEQIKDLKLIIVDPASRFRGGEENSNEDATRFVEALETLAKKTGATMLIAHHTNKGSYSADNEPGQGASRGASALTDGLRWQMNLGRLTDKQLGSIGATKEHAGRYVAATVTKTNYSAFPAPILMERGDDGYLTALTAAQAKQREEINALQRVVRTLHHQPKPIAARTLEEQFGGISGVLKMPKQDVRNVVKMAIERGLLSGGERKPLTLTAQGRAMAVLTGAAAEDASPPPKKSPRNKT